MTFLDVIVSTQGSPEGRGGTAWTAAADHWAVTVGLVARDAVKARAPVGRGVSAGQLRNSINMQRSGGAGVMQVDIVAFVPYAGYVVDGTRPHMIVPRNAKVLHFQAGGADVFTRRVNHPGTKPNPFARVAVEAVLPAVRAAFTEIMQEAMGGMP